MISFLPIIYYCVFTYVFVDPAISLYSILAHCIDGKNRYAGDVSVRFLDHDTIVSNKVTKIH